MLAKLLVKAAMQNIDETRQLFIECGYLCSHADNVQRWPHAFFQNRIG